MSSKKGNTTVPASGAKSLWNSVIAQAIEDATSRVNPERSSHSQAHGDRLRAREWLTIPNRDFDIVCDLAGLEPDCVRAYAAQEIAKAIANPPKRRRAAAPGVGQNFSVTIRDRSSPATQEIEQIGFSQNRELVSCR